MEKSLTPQEVSNIADDNIKLVLSSGFGRFNNINELIDPKKYIDKVLLLFQKQHEVKEKIKLKEIVLNNRGEMILDDEGEPVINEYKKEIKHNIIDGHYCGLLKKGDDLYFYDSYGDFPTDQLKYINPNYRKETDQVKNYLADLMVNSPYRLHYNPYKHQEAKRGINTCGRHCALFLKSEMDPEDYNRLYKSIKKTLKYNGKYNDKIVTDLTKDMI